MPARTSKRSPSPETRSTGTSAPVGIREQQSEERRRDVIRAARELLAQTSDGSFSMQVLAEKAGVSLATPYNLFGSKAAILHAVFASEVGGLNRAVEGVSTRSPFEAVLDVADLLAAAFSKKPSFYRGMVREMSSLGHGEHERMIRPLSTTMLDPLMRSLERDGALRPVVSAAVARQHLLGVLGSVMLTWTSAEWSIVRLRDELRAGFALAAMAALREPHLTTIPERAATALAAVAVHYK